MVNVIQILLSIIITIGYLCLYTVYGYVFLTVFKISIKSITKTMLTGFFVYFSLFQIVALPMKVLLQPLSYLSILWCGINFLFIIILFVNRHMFDFKQLFKDTCRIVISNKIEYIILFVIIITQFVIIMTNAYPGSIMDGSFYIGETTASLQSNTIGQFNAYSGLKQSSLTSNYLLENMGVHSAVICQLTGIHPLMEYNTCIRAIVVILSDLLVFRIALTLFEDNHKKALIMFWFAILVNFCYINVYSPSSFLYSRTGEGKTFAGVIVLPMVFLLLLELYKAKEDKGIWTVLFVTTLGATCINMTALFVAPVLAFCMLVPILISKKSWKWIANYIFCMVPALFAFLYYYLFLKGYFVVYIP